MSLLIVSKHYMGLDIDFVTRIKEIKEEITSKKSWRTLTVRILSINIFALLFLMGGMLYLNQFREGLINSKINSLLNEGTVIAGALSQSAIDKNNNDDYFIDSFKASSLIRRMVNTTSKRARVFNSTGSLISDSRAIMEAGRNVQAENLPKKPNDNFFFEQYVLIKKKISKLDLSKNKFPYYYENANQKAGDYFEVLSSLSGEAKFAKRISNENLMLSVAIPIQSFKTIQGALLLSSYTYDIEEKVSQFQMNIIKVSGLSLIITILLSLYLSNVIASPVKQLAKAANRVRKISNRQIEIPNFTERGDEIGELSFALRDMTKSLYNRIDAIESFAADVSHEIKNPLTSLMSAIELLEKDSNVDQNKKLIEIIKLDLKRIDRLITDISNVSRLDAELSRSKMRPINIDNLVETIPLIYNSKNINNDIILKIKNKNIWTLGIYESLGQIIKNFVDNSLSFSEPSDEIIIRVWAKREVVCISCEDEGPGFEPLELNKIFDRFYTRRNSYDSFGQHSGLGLYISKKIAKVHSGEIIAKNKEDKDGKIIGAILILELPILSKKK